MSVMRKLRTKVTEYPVEELSIDALVIDPARLQVRETLNVQLARHYGECRIHGAEFPPVLVYRVGKPPDQVDYLADGFHRVHAFRELGFTSIRAVVRPGTVQKYFPLSVASRFSGLSTKTLERRIKSHQLEVFRVGRRRLVELDEVERLIRSGRVAVA